MSNKDRVLYALKTPAFYKWLFSLSFTFVFAYFAGGKIAYSCLKSAAFIIAAICFGSMIMAFMERFLLFDAFSLPFRPLIKFSRLPRIAGAVFSVAFFSRMAANAMLVGERKKQRITRREMIFAAMGSSYPSMAFNYFQIMFPVIAAIGFAGIIYFAVMNIIGVLVTFLVLCLARFYLQESKDEASDFEGNDNEEKPSWNTVWKNFRARTRMLISRIVLITVPMFVLTAFAADKGFFKFIQDYFPDKLKLLLSPEIITVAFARMGSIFGAAGIASELLRQNQIDMKALVFAFLLGNLLSMPFRFIRKTLPASIGIFSGTDGFIIASGPQALRLIFILTAILIVYFL